MFTVLENKALPLRDMAHIPNNKGMFSEQKAGNANRAYAEYLILNDVATFFSTCSEQILLGVVELLLIYVM